MMAHPPTTSLASAYGPSTRLTSPLRTTKFTASSVPYRPPPSRNTPLAACSPMYVSMASNSACGGVPTPSSILTNPMKRGILITPTGCWGLLLARTSNGCPALRHAPVKFLGRVRTSLVAAQGREHGDHGNLDALLAGAGRSVVNRREAHGRARPHPDAGHLRQLLRRRGPVLPRHEGSGRRRNRARCRLPLQLPGGPGVPQH